MTRILRLLCTAICFALAGCAASAGNRHVVEPVALERGASADEIAARLKLWMSPEEVKRVVDAMHPRRMPHDGGEGVMGYERYETGPDEFLVLKFAMLRDPGEEPRIQLTHIDVRRFDDLQKVVPSELFPALRLIQHSPSPQGIDFDPLPLIKAVNGLLPLGKEQALRTLRAYVYLKPPVDYAGDVQYDLDPQRVFLIARLLFIRKDGDPHMPWMNIGGTEFDVQRDSSDWPLYPLAVVNDVPFFLPQGYNLGGVPEWPGSHLDYCEANCVLRSRPLTPTQSPVAAAQTLFESKEWQRLGSSGFALFTPSSTDEGAKSRTKIVVQLQALSMLENLLPGVSDDRAVGFYADSDQTRDQRWADYREEFRRFPLAWDPRNDEFRSAATGREVNTNEHKKHE